MSNAFLCPNNVFALRCENIPAKYGSRSVSFLLNFKPVFFLLARWVAGECVGHLRRIGRTARLVGSGLRERAEEPDPDPPQLCFFTRVGEARWASYLLLQELVAVTACSKGYQDISQRTIALHALRRDLYVDLLVGRTAAPRRGIARLY